MKKNLLNSREGGREGEAAAFYGRAMFSLAGYPFENVATTVEPWKEGRKEGRKEEEGSMNLGCRSFPLSSSPSLSLSLARDYSDVMLMRMATKEISRRRRGRKEDGGEKRGER